ncbi:HAMP domain-containing sensor histidine kinase [Actinocorallia longicatena]|uniref:histidine kinase n=1 Tax=Actinocorallia longicatena TaxID=111803 RepID=A0ABP6Q703_9ACTN
MRGRATVVAVTLTAVVAGACAVLAWLLVTSQLRDEATGQADATAQRVAVLVREEVPGRPIAVRPGESDLVQIVDGDGTVLNATARLQGEPPLSGERPVSPEIRVASTVCPADTGECRQLIGYQVRHSAYGKPVMVYAAAPLPMLAYGPSLAVLLLAQFLLTLLIVANRTWATIGLTLRPVEEIRERMADITTTVDLARRVPVPPTGGEIQRLAETVNDTLHRLENATERERRFVSDASHDLRNPIAGLMTRLEVLVGEPDGTDWRDQARAALHGAEHLHAIVDDLLELARLDAGSVQPTRPIDLHDLVTAELGRRDWRVAVEPVLEEGVMVTGSPVRLARVLNNLLANADRHAATRVGVLLTTDPGAGQAVIEITDDGSGIAPADRERVFERFARLPEGRRLDSGGTGLGLPIALEIARAHHGTLSLADSPAGARFVLRLPLSAPSAAAPETRPGDQAGT